MIIPRVNWEWDPINLLNIQWITPLISGTAQLWLPKRMSTFGRTGKSLKRIDVEQLLPWLTKLRRCGGLGNQKIPSTDYEIGVYVPPFMMIKDILPDVHDDLTWRWFVVCGTIYLIAYTDSLNRGNLVHHQKGLRHRYYSIRIHHKWGFCVVFPHTPHILSSSGIYGTGRNFIFFSNSDLQIGWCFPLTNWIVSDRFFWNF